MNPDVYKVRDGAVIAKAVAAKQLAIRALPAGGTGAQAIEPERQHKPALTDDQVLRLAQLGRRIEAHFGHPQDMEWCLADDDFRIVQSRPITTLFNKSDEEGRLIMSDWSGETNMVVGASRGLGRRIATAFAEAGGPVVACPAREEDRP